MLRTAIVVAASMLAATILASQSGIPPGAWAAANRAVTRLAPDDVNELPAVVRSELTRRGCTIPQPADAPIRNVARGDFFGAGSDWAVLCSRELRSSILVFRGARADHVYELASRNDEDFLQGSTGGRIVFSRGIRAASPAMIHQLQESYHAKAGRRLAHAGIEDMFLGKASVVWYWRGAKWVVVAGSD